jgi:hypothetical protein
MNVECVGAPIKARELFGKLRKSRVELHRPRPAKEQRDNG